MHFKMLKRKNHEHLLMIFGGDFAYRQPQSALTKLKKTLMLENMTNCGCQRGRQKDRETKDQIFDKNTDLSIVDLNMQNVQVLLSPQKRIIVFIDTFGLGTNKRRRTYLVIVLR